MTTTYVRADDFVSFMKDRRMALLKIIGTATSHSVNGWDGAREESEDVARDCGIALAIA